VTDELARDHARDWSFDELVREGGSLIASYAPQWTNHNPSDPGITLLELLAYFSEILAYRALRITPDAKLHFLRLLEGRTVSPSDVLIGVPSRVIDEAIRTRVEALSRAECAVTTGDFEQLAVDAAATYPDGRPGLRAKCVPGLDLRRLVGTQHPAATDASADVSIVLALEPDLPSEVADGLCRHVQEALASRCLLTTRAYVVRAPHFHVTVGCRISPEPGVPLSVAAEAIDAALRRRFDPMQSDEPIPDTRSLGRPLHLATVAAAIDRTDGVDYVENVIVLRMSIDGAIDDDESLVGIRIGVIARLGEDTRLGGLASVGMRRLQTDHTGETETVFVQPWELVHVRLDRYGARGIGDTGFAFSAGGPRRG
jgi:hypothetical protein